MSIVLIIETPLQLLCAYEAIKISKGDYKLYVRCTKIGKNDEQVVQMLDYLKLEYTLIHASVGSNISLFFAVLKFLFFSLKIKKIDRLYIGSYFSKFQRLLSMFFWKKELFFLDDGMATLLVYKQVDKANFFTFFNLESRSGKRVETHSFKNLKVLRKNLDEKEGNFFIGQPFIDKNMIEREEYIGFILQSLEMVGNEKIYYIPHRVESKLELDNISKISDRIKVIETNECIELFFIKSGFNPLKVFTCCSTSIYSLSLLYPACSFVSFTSADKRILNLPHWPNINELISSIDKIEVVNKKC